MAGAELKMAGAELDVDPLSRDEIIRGNLEAFLPYICDCVKATDLLKLQYFSKEQRRQIFQLLRNDSVGATKMAMNIVLHECKDPGRFVALKYAMESSGYPKIVQMLEGEHVPCDENCEKILDLFTHEIVQRLNPIELLSVLISQGTLSSDDADEIRAEEQNHSRIRACYMLLFYLPNRVEEWFKNFEEALIICEYDDIAEILEPELCSKIMLQRRAEEEEILGQVSEETCQIDMETLLSENDSARLVCSDDGSKREDLESDDNITEKKGITDRRPSAETEDSSCQQESVGFNDLNADVEHPSEKQDYNIVTDEDVINEVKDEGISLRNYQKELAKEGAEGDNVVIMAPTNSCKTRVACKIMQEHLRRQRAGGRIGKVIFLVENEALAFQQGKICAELLPAYRTKVISGSVQRDKKQYLRDFVDRRDILVVTAQVLVNALKLKEVRCLTQFSMIVFDDCHHTASLHRFNEIMRLYMDLKLKAELSADKLPQIVGLTASLGVGGKTTEDGALQHMKGLLANYDAKHLCTVRRNIEELRSFETNQGIVVAKKREKDVYGKAICDIVELINMYMSSHQSILSISSSNKSLETVCQVPPCLGTEQFAQWLSDFRKAIGKITSDEARRTLNLCRFHLEMYNQALLIHKDARIQDAQEILEEFMKEERKVPPKNETDAMLTELYGTLERKDVSKEPPNPKLAKLEEIICDKLGNNQDARTIVFVKTRKLAKALVAWINQTESLKDLHAEEFVGQGASAAQGGMTKSGQKDVLEYFKGGRTKIIVATSVAEEGLHITKCNLVIHYEYLANEIVRLQSRGRSRASNGMYFVLTEEGSWIVAKEEKKSMLEELDRVVPELQEYIENNPNLWEKELTEIQMAKKMAEDLREKQRKEYMTSEEMKLRCSNCGHFICFSVDIRLIRNTHLL